jgi:SAM-dependent methyltransferase
VRDDPGDYFKTAGVAANYDRYIGDNIPYYWSTLRDICLRLKKIYGSTAENMIAIEFGAGTGNFSLMLLKQLALRRILMLDHSQGMLAAARNKIQVNEVPTQAIATLHSSILDRAWMTQGEFSCPDLVVFHLALDHVEKDGDLTVLLRRIYSQMTVGGCLVIAEKCANGKDKLSQSWKSFEKMVHFRAEHLLKHGLMSEKQIKAWSNHLLKEDILRPLSELWSSVEAIGFRVVDACGVPLQNSVAMTYEMYYGQSVLVDLKSSSADELNQAFGIGVLVCRKTV